MISASTEDQFYFTKDENFYQLLLRRLVNISICYFYITNTIKGGGASLNLNYTTVRCESSYYGKAYYV